MKLHQFKRPTRVFHHLSDWIVLRPWLTVAIILVITGFATVGQFWPHRIHTFLNPPQDQNEQPQPIRDGTHREAPPNVNPFSIADANAIMVIESDALFSPGGAKALRNVVEKLEALEHVRSVVWMDRVPLLNIFGLPEPIVPSENASQIRFDAAKKKALANPLILGQFLSEDANTTLLLINFDYFYIESDEDCIGRLRETAEVAAKEVGETKMQFSVTGNTPLHLVFLQSNEASLLKYQIIGYSMIAVMALVLFRGIPAVLIVAAAPILGVFWTLGLLPYFEVQDNPFNNVILPVLISLVGLTDGVHLMVHIRKLRSEGLSTKEAALEGIREVGLACALTSLTTAIGFASLGVANSEVVREFGFCCVIGVACTFVSVIATIPLLSSSWLGRNVHVGLEKSLIDKNLTKIGVIVDMVLKRPKLFSFLAIAATILFAVIAAQLKPDERRVEGMPIYSEPVVALQKMDSAMGGLEIGEVNVSWNNEVASDSGEVLMVVQDVDKLLNGFELIGHPLSIRNLVDALPGDGEPVDRMSMLELLPPPLKRAFYTPEQNYAKVIFRVQDIGIAKYGPVFEEIKTGLSDIQQQHPNFQVELAKRGAVWRWEELFKIVVDLLTSLSWASLIIFAVLTVVYRSIRIGLISIVPNLFPLVLAASFLVLSGQYLEMVSVCAFTICLGIAVDDTIHFLTRYQEELAKTDDEELAIRRAFTGVGTALIMTTAVLLAGFGTVLMSENREHRIFAWMGAITIASALFADLVFLPALLAKFGPSKKPKTNSANDIRE